MTLKDKIINKSIELLERNLGGLRFSELHREIAQLPDVNKNSISGYLVKLDSLTPLIYKPSKGLFKHINFKEKDSGIATPKNPKERDFYMPFAEWLVNELEECTKAIPLGGAKFGGKWGTPDVIGIKEPKKSDIVKYPTEIITAEIKLDTLQLITAFGQVCAYRLFSHKSFIVIPKSSSKEDIDRIDSLSMLYGIGLVVFDNKSSINPNFELRVRPSRHEPDMFYLNENLKLIEDDLF